MGKTDVWSKSAKYGHYLVEVQHGRVALVRLGRGRYGVYTDVAGDEDRGYKGKYLTWRPTLKEAKERAAWAYLADLGRADDDYKDLGH